MKAGISFVIRVRNEERVLARSLESLRRLQIPHEIIVVLHLCSDRSAEIAHSFPNMRIFDFKLPISRAGYETLATPAASPHSLISYVNWCFEKAMYLWCFRWDADFVATPELIAFLNSRPWDDPTPTRIRIPAMTEGAEVRRGGEPYLFNAGRDHGKYIFWEYNRSAFQPEVKEEIITAAAITRESPLKDEYIKDYWRAPPWFANWDSAEAAELRRRYDFLVRMMGPEPLGLARGMNSQCDGYFWLVQEQSKESELAAEGINLWF